MTYSPKLSSAFNDTFLRSRHVSAQSGMCSFCTEECDGTCEVALAAVLGGARTVYPTNTGNNQVASEKKFTPLIFPTLTLTAGCLGGRVGGCAENYEEANIYHVQLGRTYGRFNDVKLALPVILPALIKLNWQDYFGGGRLWRGIGRNWRKRKGQGSEPKIENGKSLSLPA